MLERSALYYGTSPAIWDHTVLPATRHRWIRPPNPSQWLTYPGGIEGWVDLGGWLYQDGLPAHRWSPIQLLTGPDVEQLRWSRQCATAKPGHQQDASVRSLPYQRTSTGRVLKHAATFGSISDMHFTTATLSWYSRINHWQSVTADFCELWL